MVTLTVAEMVGIAGFVLAVSLAIARVLDRVRLSTTTMKSYNYYGDSEQHDDNYELLVTNMGSRPTTITHITVHAYKRMGLGRMMVGGGEMFVSDEHGLSFVVLKPGDSEKFDFPFHRLVSAVGEATTDDTGKRKRLKADGHLCRIHHTARPWPKQVILR
jgi:hypothetical protein